MYHDFESHTITRRSFLKGAGAVGAAGLLAACGGSSSSTAASASSASSGAAASGKGLSELFTYETSGREIESWNMLYSQQAIDFNVTTNIIDGLISFDNYGKPVPALAKSWEHNEDSTVWTFHLRDDVDWVDMNGEVQDHLTSKDGPCGNTFKNIGLLTRWGLLRAGLGRSGNGCGQSSKHWML